MCSFFSLIIFQYRKMNLKLRLGKVKTRRNRSKTSLTSSRHNLRRLIRRSKIEKVTNRRICDAYTDLVLI